MNANQGNKIWAYVIVILCVLLSACNSSSNIDNQVSQNDETKERDGVEKDVKRYVLSKRTSYDSEGRVIGIEEFYPNGETAKVLTYEYFGNGTRELLYEFDEYGMITKCFYNGTGDWGEWRYDANGNRKEFIEYNEQNKVTRKKEYDAKGNIIKWLSYDSDGSISQWEEDMYDSKGNPLQSIVHGSDNSVLCSMTFECDEHGRVTRQTEYDSGGKISTSTTFEYDENGNEIRETVYDSGGKVIYSAITEYDENGNEIKYSANDEEDGSSYLTINEYDAKGNNIKWTRYVDGTENSWAECEYDSHGNLIKQVNYDAYCVKEGYVEEGEPWAWVEHTYIYDENDNIMRSNDRDWSCGMNKVNESYSIYEYNEVASE